MVASGPFSVVRHPANASAAALLLLDPKMTERKLTVALLAAVYRYVGSLHEEHRLLHAYGDAYARYQRRCAVLRARLRPMQMLEHLTGNGFNVAGSESSAIRETSNRESVERAPG